MEGARICIPLTTVSLPLVKHGSVSSFNQGLRPEHVIFNASNGEDSVAPEQLRDA